MCTNKILVRNNSRYIDTETSPQLFRLVNCGHCSECLSAKKKEIQLRMHYELMDCISHGGYALIDCLTYRPECLPRLNRFFDVPLNYAYKCFDYNDVRLFLVRLRQHLVRLGFPSHVFTQYYVGEFGIDPRFTKRPHYHIVFFVRANIAPEFFSLLVSVNWKLGRTDGIFWTNRDNVNYNTLSSKFTSEGRLSAIADYLSKYLYKSQALQKSSFKKSMNLFQYWYGICDYSELDYSQRLLFRRVRSFLQPFQRYSHGFGLSCLNAISLEYINKNQSVYYQVGDFRLEIPVPLYFVRKLFFKQEKNQFGSYSWIPNELYSDFFKASYAKKFKYLSNALRLLGVSNCDDVAFVYYNVFGRVNYNGLPSVVNDCRNPLESVFLNGYYSYIHPRFGLGVVSKIPLVSEFSDHGVSCSVFHKVLISDKILTYENFALRYLDSSELVTESVGFYPAFGLFLDKKNSLNDKKNEAYDLKMKIQLLFKNKKKNSKAYV